MPQQHRAAAGAELPPLAERGHGSWYFHCSAPNLFGRSERIRRGGYPSQTAAREARAETLADSAARRAGDHDQTLLTYHAAPQSPSADGLRLLASWGTDATQAGIQISRT
ncbi:MAG TPA: hypothetical protein VN408_07125 [Actinoplanes sp.]|nr:hypothetical protein [Actinoplanes sp.]